MSAVPYPPRITDEPLSHIGIRTSVSEMLHDMDGIDTIGELVVRSERDLLRIRNIGPAKIAHIVERLRAYNLELRDDTVRLTDEEREAWYARPVEDLALPVLAANRIADFDRIVIETVGQLCARTEADLLQRPHHKRAVAMIVRELASHGLDLMPSPPPKPPVEDVKELLTLPHHLLVRQLGHGYSDEPASVLAEWCEEHTLHAAAASLRAGPSAEARAHVEALAVLFGWREPMVMVHWRNGWLEEGPPAPPRDGRVRDVRRLNLNAIYGRYAHEMEHATAETDAFFGGRVEASAMDLASAYPAVLQGGVSEHMMEHSNELVASATRLFERERTDQEVFVERLAAAFGDERAALREHGGSLRAIAVHPSASLAFHRVRGWMESLEASGGARITLERMLRGVSPIPIDHFTLDPDSSASAERLPLLAASAVIHAAIADADMTAGSPFVRYVVSLGTRVPEDRSARVTFAIERTTAPRQEIGRGGG